MGDFDAFLKPDALKATDPPELWVCLWACLWAMILLYRNVLNVYDEANGTPSLARQALQSTFIIAVANGIKRQTSALC